MTTCTGTINLRTPARSERVRGFQPPWYTVFVYCCDDCGSERRVRAGSFTGTCATPSVGAIVCGAPVVEESSFEEACDHEVVGRPPYCVLCGATGY